MQSRPSRWKSEPYEVAAGRALAQGSAFPRSSGASSPGEVSAESDEARRFLAADEAHDPRSLPGVPAACELILGHVERGSPIAVFGDYDVDGVCSTAILRPHAARAGADRSGSCQPLRRGLRPVGGGGRAARRLAAWAARDRGLRDHGGRAGGRRAGRGPRGGRHRPHRPGEELPDCTARPPGARRVRLSGAVRLGRGAEAERGAVRGRGSRPCLGRRGHRPRRARHGLRPGPLRGENRRIVREGLGSWAGRASRGCGR